MARKKEFIIFEIISFRLLIYFLISSTSFYTCINTYVNANINIPEAILLFSIQIIFMAMSNIINHVYCSITLIVILYIFCLLYIHSLSTFTFACQLEHLMSNVVRNTFLLLFLANCSSPNAKNLLKLNIYIYIQIY